MGAVGSSSMPSYDYDNATNFTGIIKNTIKWFNNDKLSNYGEWKDSLTYKENEAISSFTGTGYNKSFAELYSEDWDSLSDYAKEKASALYDAINKFELKKPINVYRYADSKLFGEKGMTFEQLKALEGKIVHSNGFMSTSAADHGTAIESSDLQMKITIPKSIGAGAFVAEKSSLGVGEKEFLLNNNGFYRIESVTKDNYGTPQVSMKWVGQSKDQIFGGSGNKGSIETKTVSKSVKKKK